MTSNTEILSAWQTSAQYWEKHRALIERMFAPLTRALIEEAQVRSKAVVLDIGGGSGEPSLTLARTVGPEGLITYTDPVPAMVDAARGEATRRGLKNILFGQCAAQALPFSNDSFDCVVGRLSAMFFPEPLAGLREALRVVRPKGLVSFVVWADRDLNPFFGLMVEVMARFIESPPEDPDAPGAFRFAVPGKLVQLMRDAGAATATERQVDFRIEASISPERFWELRTEMSDTLREKIARLSSEQLQQAKLGVEEAVRPFFSEGRMSFPAYAIIVSATKA